MELFWLYWGITGTLTSLAAALHYPHAAGAHNIVLGFIIGPILIPVVIVGIILHVYKKKGP